MILIIKGIIKVTERLTGPIVAEKPAGPTVREVIEDALAVKEDIKAIEEIRKVEDKVEEDDEKEEIIVEEDLIHSRTVIKRFSNDQVMANIIIIEDLDQIIDMTTGMK